MSDSDESEDDYYDCVCDDNDPYPSCSIQSSLPRYLMVNLGRGLGAFAIDLFGDTDSESDDGYYYNGKPKYVPKRMSKFCLGSYRINALTSPWCHFRKQYCLRPAHNIIDDNFTYFDSYCYSSFEFLPTESLWERVSSTTPPPRVAMLDITHNPNQSK